MASPGMVSMNVMLAIHCKRTASLDLHRPLKNYIKQQFSERDANEAEEDLQLVNSMRQQVERQGEALEERRDLLQRYFRALSVMEARFPISPDKPPLNHINFTWQDAFKTTKKASQCSIYFEKAAIVFNLAATYSQMGLAADRSTVPGLKQACNCFMAAAGAFGYLRDKLASKATSFMSTIDLTPECAGMLERLMLGQAQECFFEKSKTDEKPPNLRARIAMQVGLFYEEAHAALTLPPLSSQFDRSWVGNVQCKALLFQAEALYNLALHLNKEEEKAEEIARLRMARDLLQEARKQGKVVLQHIMDGVLKLEATAQLALEKAEKENDKVYLMRVPNPSSLPAIAGAPLASPLAPDASLDASGEKLFSSIIPDSRTKDLSRYTDMVDSLIRQQSERLQGETELAKVKLRELELPDVLQALDGDVGVWVPPKLREDWQAAQGTGGPSSLQGELLQLQDLKRVNEGLLAGLDEVLEKESQEDASIRVQFGSRWTRPQSSTLNKSLKDRAVSFAANLKQAAASDARIEKDFQDSQDLLSILNHTRIEDALPRISRPLMAVHGDDQALVGRLRHLLGELEGLGAQRAALEVTLKDMRTKENILPQLMNSTASTCEDLFKKELAKFDPVVADVDRNIDAQKRLLDDIKAQTLLFSSTFNIPEYKREVDRVLHKVEAALAKLKELRPNMHEGLKFYVAMQDAISALKQQCQDFVMTRNIQSRDLIDELQRSLSGLSFSSTTGAAEGAAAFPVPPTTAPPPTHAYAMPQAQTAPPAHQQEAPGPRVAQPVAQPQPQPQPQAPQPQHQAPQGPQQQQQQGGVVDSFINFLGHLVTKPGSTSAPPPHAGTAPPQPQAPYYHTGAAAPAPPPPVAASYYQTSQGGAAPHQLGQPPQVPGYFSHAPPAPVAGSYGVQPGMYSQTYGAPGAYGAPQPQYGQPQAPNPYPHYSYPPQ